MVLLFTENVLVLYQSKINMIKREVLGGMLYYFVPLDGVVSYSIPVAC